MALKTIAAPAFEPVTLAAAKLALRIDGTDLDADISALIAAARQMAEHETGRALATQTLELVLDEFPAAEIVLPRPPCLSVASVKYLDDAGVLQTLATGAYALYGDVEPAWLMPAYGTAWPGSVREVPEAVRVRFDVGYASGNCPASIQRWIIAQVGQWLRNPEAYSDKPLTAAPGLAALLDPYRMYE